MISYEDTIAYHIECELGYNLYDILNMNKCNKLNLNPYKIRKRSNIKLWFLCQEREYHNDYDGYDMTCSNFYYGHRCSYCAKKKKIHPKDSLGWIFPNIAKMIAIPENDLTFEDTFKISPKSDKKKYFIKCYECSQVSSKTYYLQNLVNGLWQCEFCSDKLTIPNKWIQNLLKQLNISFQSEYSPYYFRKTQTVDIFIPSMNLIIEMDGNYGNHTREYDYWRDFLNMKYGGYKTIRIDLKNNYHLREFECLKEESIKSLSHIFNLSNINWELIWKESQKSKCFKAWELWNSGIHSTTEIGRILNLSQATIITYLKRGVKCGKCDYSKEESLKCMGENNKGINNPFAKMYWVIMENGEKYNDRPLSGKEIYNDHTKGLLNISYRSFSKYIRPYGNIDTSRIKGKSKTIDQLRRRLEPFNNWKIIEIK